MARAASVGRHDGRQRSLSALAAFLSGEVVAWRTFGMTSAELLDVCSTEELTGLVNHRVNQCSHTIDWPEEFREALTRASYADAAKELLRQREIASVLDALASAGIYPILLKGTPLAYTVYDVPSARPRADTDLFIRKDDVAEVRRLMYGLGYTAPVLCDGDLLFCQFAVEKTDRFNVEHAFDFHWKISTQSLFADLLSYNDLAEEARPVPPLGPHARAHGLVHALLLASVHPTMHHQNLQRMLWIHDVHLLSSQLSAEEFDRLVDLAVIGKVAAIVLGALSVAHARFGTIVPARANAELSAVGTAEPSAAYLRPHRRWHDELRSSIGALPDWRSRVRLLREVGFPDHAYMRRSYRLPEGGLGTALLPALYLYRIGRGARNVLLGRK